MPPSSPSSVRTSAGGFRPRWAVGVDFSGSKQAGNTAWLAVLEVGSRAFYRLTELRSLASMAGTASREACYEALVRRVLEAQDTLVGIDAPFSLPIELFDGGDGLAETLALVRACPGDARVFGRTCVARALERTGKMHVRRSTDVHAKAPFDSTHYRIVYQTFHVVRDVLARLRGSPGTRIFPFDPPSASPVDRVVVEACPSSTLRRLQWPYRNYKQPSGGPLTPRRRRTRRQILDALGLAVEMTDTHRRIIMRNPGGDALDAVLAAFGSVEAWRALQFGVDPLEERCRREGWIVA